MEFTYTQKGEYLIPDLMLDGADEAEEMPLGKYGLLRETYLQEHRSGTYTSMLLTGRLLKHLREVDETAREQEERMVADQMKQQGVNEALKALDPVTWVQAVNGLKAQAEEIIVHDLIYT